MPIDVEAWLTAARVQEMTAEQEGGLIRLSLIQWREGGLPACEERLLRLARVEGPPAGHRILIEAFPLEEDGMRRCRKVEATRGEVEAALGSRDGPREPREEEPWLHGLQELRALDTPEVRAAIDRWIAYRKARHLTPWKASTWFCQLRYFMPHGPAALVESIDMSIRNTYQGLFPPRGVPVPRQAQLALPGAGLPSAAELRAQREREYTENNGRPV